MKLPNIAFLNNLAIRSAYHLVEFKPEVRPYTAFEANGRFYHFRLIPFVVTIGVSSFQTIIDNMISTENLKGTFAHRDNVTVCGLNHLGHDRKVKRLMAAINKYKLTLNY